MKNSYNTIKQNLKAGLSVVVKDLKGNKYCAISPFKDGDGNYRNSGWCGSIEGSKRWIGDYCGYIKKYWDDFDLEIVEVFRPEFEPFKIGQKVKLLDSIKKTEDWKKHEDWERYDLFVNMTGEVKQVYCQMMGTYYSVNGWCIGHEYLAPLVEEEVEELTLSEVCKLLGKDIKIKK